MGVWDQIAEVLRESMLAGGEELHTMNLWVGVDPPAGVQSHTTITATQEIR